MRSRRRPWHHESWKERKAERVAHFWRFIYGWKQRPCAACNGSGRYDNNGSPRCGGCDGTGHETYKLDEEMITTFSQQCKGKHRHKSEGKAEAQLRSMVEHGLAQRHELHIYCCTFCRQYHVGHPSRAVQASQFKELSNAH